MEIPTPRSRPAVGRVIEVDLSPPGPLNNQSFMKYAMAAAVLILVAVLGVFNPLFWPGAAVASVSLDINHGIELLVDKEGKVIKASDAGKGLDYVVAGSSLKGQDIYRAVEMILEDASEKGFLENDRNIVLVSVVPLESSGSNVVDEEKLGAIVRQGMISKNSYGVVMVGRTDMDTKRRAEKMGMTVNTYLVYDRFRHNGHNIEAEDLRGGDIRKVLEENKVSIPTLFPQNSFEVKPREHMQRRGRMPNSAEGTAKTGSPYPEHGSVNSGRQGMNEDYNMNRSQGAGDNSDAAPGGMQHMDSSASTNPARPSGVTSPSQPTGDSMRKPQNYTWAPPDHEAARPSEHSGWTR